MQSEVETLKSKRVFSEQVHFPGGTVFTYSLHIREKYDAVFEGKELMVVIPEKDADTWIASEELSLRSTLYIEPGSEMSLLVEKDLACMMPREGEDESDAFPNPNKK